MRYKSDDNENMCEYCNGSGYIRGERCPACE